MLRGPKYKICKRVGGMVFPQCQTARYTASLAKKESGRKRKPKPRSEYGIQFLEKQKAKFTYGVNERQFVNYVKSSQSSKKINPVSLLSQKLETRLDNVIYRIGLATSRAFGRQIVSHGHVLVNGKKIKVPSYGVKLGDKISIKKSSLGSTLFKDLDTKLKSFKFPKWIKFDIEKIEGEVIYLPELADGDLTLNLSMVTEFYSRT